MITFLLIKNTKGRFEFADIAMDGSPKKTTIQLLISIISINIVFVLTWLLAVFMFIDGSFVFQLLFAFFNSLHGILLFVFFCVLGKQAHESWTWVLGKVRRFARPQSAPLMSDFPLETNMGRAVHSSGEEVSNTSEESTPPPPFVEFNIIATSESHLRAAESNSEETSPAQPTNVMTGIGIQETFSSVSATICKADSPVFDVNEYWEAAYLNAKTSETEMLKTTVPIDREEKSVEQHECDADISYGSDTTDECYPQQVYHKQCITELQQIGNVSGDSNRFTVTAPIKQKAQVERSQSESKYDSEMDRSSPSQDELKSACS